MAITTGKVRLSYCHIWEPQAPQNGQGEPKYSVTILIPKTDTATLNAIYTEMAAAEQQGVASKWGGVKPPIVKNPLYDGDGVRPSGEPFGEECRGCMVMTASAKNQPSVVDLQVQPILNRAEVYSGCYARVSINFFAYAQNGNKGIGCGLNAVQKIEDGEPLSGMVTAEEAFGGANAYAGIPQASGYAQYAAQPQAPVPSQPPMQSVMPGYAQYAAQPQAQVPQQPAAYQSYAAQQTPAQPMQGQALPVDPITGQPMLTGGVMGIG